METVKMGACGLDCAACEIYRAAFDRDAARALAEWLKSIGRIGEDQSADDVMKQAPYCMGCHGSREAHWSDDCFILKCCVDDKKLDHCGQCREFVCQRLYSWSKTDTQYIKALAKLKTLPKPNA